MSSAPTVTVHYDEKIGTATHDHDSPDGHTFGFSFAKFG